MIEVIEIAGQKALVGLDWRDLNSRSKRGPRAQFVKELTKKRLSKGLLLESSLSNSHVYTVVDREYLSQADTSAAAWLAQSLRLVDKATFCFHQIDDERWWMTAVQGGIVISGMDYIGSLDECYQHFLELQSLIDHQIYGPESLREKIPDVLVRNLEEIISDGNNPPQFTSGGITTATSALFAIVIIGIAGALGWNYYNDYLAQKPEVLTEPPVLGPSEEEVKRYNDARYDEALKTLLSKLSISTNPIVLFHSCENMFARYRGAYPGWRQSEFECFEEKAVSRYERTKLGTYESLTKQIDDQAVKFDQRGDNATVTHNHVSVSRDQVPGFESITDLLDQSVFKTEVLSVLQRKLRYLEGQMTVSSPKAISLTFTGWNRKGDEELISRPSGVTEGTIELNGLTRSSAKSVVDILGMIKAPQGVLRLITVSVANAANDKRDWKLEIGYVLR